MPFSSITSVDIYKNSPFRITGLSVNASTGDIAKLISRLKISAEFGGGEQPFAFALRPSPDEEKIRDAAQNLKDVESRFISSFFWFWPELGEGGVNDDAIQALNFGDHNTAGEIWREREVNPRSGFIARHNLAVMYHLIALDWTLYQLNEEIDGERASKILDLWRESLGRWKALLSSEALWDYLKEKIRKINDDRLTLGLVRKMEKSLAECLSKINAQAALQYVQRGRIEFAKEQILMMREWFPSASEADKVSEWVLDSEIKVIQRGIEKVKAESDPVCAIGEVRQLIEICERNRYLFGLFYSKDAHQLLELFNDVGWACYDKVVAYRKATDDYPTCAESIKRLLPFASDAKLREWVSGSLEFYEKQLRNKPLEDLMAKLNEICHSGGHPKTILSQIEAVILPQFCQTKFPRQEFATYFDAIAIALRGVSLDAWNNHKDKRTALKACKLALSLAVAPEKKRQLEEDCRTLSAQKSGNAGCLWIIGAIGFFWIVSLFNTNYSSSRTASGARYTAPTTYSTPRPIYSTPSPTYSTPAPPYSTPRSTYAAPSTGYSGNARTYSVPNSKSAELARDREAIQVAKAQAENYSTQLDSLGSEIKRARAFLNQSSQYEIDEFNRKVDRYNSMLVRQKELDRSVNQMVGDYNAKLRLYGR